MQFLIPQPEPIVLPEWVKSRYPGLDESFQVQFIPKGETIWKSNPGMQTWFLLCPFDEILFGGTRGCGKSDALIAWGAMGDPSLPEDDPARASYLNAPTYRCLYLREEYQSMLEFIDRAVEFYRHFGGKAAGNPVHIKFESGAKIYFNHLGDAEAFNKYRGHNITRIGIEELTQIPKFAQYLKLLGSLRSVERRYKGKTYPRLRTQIASTTNPDGPGAQWVKERFVRVRAKDGKLIPWNTPMVDPITSRTRIFIPGRISDNPYLREDKQYLGNLLAQDEVTRKQWILGDWDAASGAFFREYRPDGPQGTEEQRETPWARHIPVEEPELKTWWFRWGSGDWGFDHPSVWHKFCFNEEDQRIHVYDELQVRHVGSFELGVLLAKWWMPDLELLPDHQITIYLSPDAFSKTDASKTKAEQIESGIKQVLGPYGALLLKYNDEEKAVMQRDPKAAAAMFEYRKAEFAGRLSIALKPANTDRIAGASYLRELLRFRPILADMQPDPEHLRRVLELRGLEQYEKELTQWKNQKPEVLPKIQIWRKCKGADRCLREAVHDDPPRAEDVRKWDAEDGIGGDDAYDSLRHGVMAYKEIKSKIPKTYWVSERLREIQQAHEESYGQPLTDPTRIAMVIERQNALYDKSHAGFSGTLRIPRLATYRTQ
jgi:hypothetical protein